MKADLHVHSHYSDGASSVEELIANGFKEWLNPFESS